MAAKVVKIKILFMTFFIATPTTVPSKFLILFKKDS